MYEVTSSPFVSRTRATLRSAEFGFFGVVVYTRMQTPRFCGHACIAGVFDFLRTASRPCRTSWLMVGMTLHRRERRQNSHFIAERPFLVKGLDMGGPTWTWGAPQLADPPSPPHPAYPAAATEPSPSGSTGGGSRLSTASSGLMASPPGVSTSTRV